MKRYYFQANTSRMALDEIKGEYYLLEDNGEEYEVVAINPTPQAIARWKAKAYEIEDTNEQ